MRCSCLRPPDRRRERRLYDLVGDTEGVGNYGWSRSRCERKFVSLTGTTCRTIVLNVFPVLLFLLETRTSQADSQLAQPLDLEAVTKANLTTHRHVLRYLCRPQLEPFPYGR